MLKLFQKILPVENLSDITLFRQTFAHVWQDLENSGYALWNEWIFKAHYERMVTGKHTIAFQSEKSIYGYDSFLMLTNKNTMYQSVSAHYK